MRLTAQKAFLQHDCGRRNAPAMLKRSKPLNRDYGVDDWTMYMVTQGVRRQPAPNARRIECAGPARVITLEQKMVR
eukprot:12029063-Prorocentrum_lima.AAC.1